MSQEFQEHKSEINPLTYQAGYVDQGGRLEEGMVVDSGEQMIEAKR